MRSFILLFCVASVVIACSGSKPPPTKEPIPSESSEKSPSTESVAVPAELGGSPKATSGDCSCNSSGDAGHTCCQNHALNCSCKCNSDGKCGLVCSRQSC